ncbi:MAG TPA: TIM44-like domain-containing protein [Gemmataceae bacterium]|nr:TIM44-like domain-containing protein [Gemmataceae bacterium]
MRPLIALALLAVLIVASPAVAQIGDPGDSTSQTQAYGTFFAYVCGGIGLIALILGGIHVVKGMQEEARRGKTTGVLREQILDDHKKKVKRDLYLGERVPDWKMGNRKEATEAALRLLSRTDKRFTLKHLTDVASEAYVAVKAALEVRSWKAIQKFVTADCLDKLKAEMKKLHDEGVKHVFGKVEVVEVHIVHVEAPANVDNHSFTALIEAESRDYFADEKTGKIKRGDKKTYAVQEFWHFRRAGKNWLLERIRTSSDMDYVLNAKNVLTRADLDVLAKKLDEKHIREFVAK